MSRDPKPKHDQEMLESKTKLESMKKELTRVQKELDRVSGEFSTVSDRHRSLNTKYAVTVRAISDIRNEIFILRRKRTEEEENSLRLTKEIDLKQSVLDNLQEESQSIETSLIDIEPKNQQVSDTISSSELQKKDLESKLADLRAERRGLSKDISSLLEKTSLESDEIEAEMISVTSFFQETIEERDTVKTLLSEHLSFMSQLREEVSNLESLSGSLKGAKGLTDEIKSLTDEVQEKDSGLEPVRKKLGNLRKDLSEKESEYEAKTAAIVRERVSITELEKEIGNYKQAIEGFQNAEAQRKETRALLEEYEKRLKTLFAEKNRLEGALGQMTGNLEHLEGFEKLLG